LIAALGIAVSLAAIPDGPSPTPRASLVGGKVFLTVDEALELAFPECEIEHGTEFLPDEVKKRVAKLAKGEFEDGIVHPYVARKEGEVVGTAYFDTHRVRTLRETMMFVVDSEGKLARVELLSFGEPLDYIPRDAWYGQFLGRPLDDELNLKRAIRPVTGATLTARATTDAARRTLALHQVLAELEAERKKREEERKRKEQEKEKEKKKTDSDGDGDGETPPPDDGGGQGRRP
jgi:hypothetical protein